MQYSRYVSFDQEDWKHYLTNAIFLAATSCGWSLEKGLAGPWSGAIVFESEENRAHYETMKSRLPTLSHNETLRVTLDPEHTLVKGILSRDLFDGRNTAPKSRLLFRRRHYIGYDMWDKLCSYGVCYKVVHSAMNDMIQLMTELFPNLKEIGLCCLEWRYQLRD
ncbi:hypothetical protein EV424DRAFT_1342453 [Suillus variegatus]|nr:hypothetical protein EV424DRAFT_1342453 [Suillus variegatus]